MFYKPYSTAPYLKLLFYVKKKIINSFHFKFRINFHYNGVTPNPLTDSKLAPLFINKFKIFSLNSITKMRRINKQTNKPVEIINHFNNFKFKPTAIRVYVYFNSIIQWIIQWYVIFFKVFTI